MKAANIAEIVHETNRTYCRLTGDNSQLPWAEAPDWQKSSAINGVEGILNGTITRPEESHESWLAEKERTGWTYGPVKDADKKEHPCFVAYEDLPAEQQIKDALFFGIVRAFMPPPRMDFIDVCAAQQEGIDAQTKAAQTPLVVPATITGESNERA